MVSGSINASSSGREAIIWEVPTMVVRATSNSTTSTWGPSHVVFRSGTSASTCGTTEFWMNAELWSNGTIICHTVDTSISWIRPRVQTPEEARRQTFANERRRRQAVRSGRLEAMAKGRAEELLRGCLDERQVTDLEERGFFDVFMPSSDGASRTYRIRRGYAGNVKLLDPSGKEAVSYCIHPGIRVPDADSMLAQKLLLEADERMFLATANARVLR